MTAQVEWCEISGPVDGWFQCWVRTAGDTQEDCRALAVQMLGLIASGRKRVIRREPYADGAVDFATGMALCQGGVRFAFRDEAGDDAVAALGSEAELRYLPLPPVRGPALDAADRESVE